MTDRSYTGLRAALDAGPKGGKWTWKQVGSYSTPGCAVFWPDTSKGGTHYRRLDSGGGMEQADAEFIANANPATIRALLADYDRMRDALIGAVAVAREAHAHWDAVRDAKLGKLLLALSGYEPGYDPRTDAVQAALTQEAHDAD